jgi:hypothetical protein
MSPLALGRRVLPLAAAATLAVGATAASSPSVASASTPNCVKAHTPRDPASPITLCHSGFEPGRAHAGMAA